MIMAENVTPVQKKRAVLYCRVSTEGQKQDGESLEYQEEKGRQYAELHDIEVVLVLKEAKSGYIHYSLRGQLTIARQMIRDHLVDMIIVWDLRRFSRNFVHSAMIFEEIESNGGEIVSVSENIDNSLTGKLIRSILSWSAESEREKIVEYANRRWQSRLELGLPVGTGIPPYGWDWVDKDKTKYVINKEEALVRLSLFQMFVEMDMSIRGIAAKLTADGVLTPTQARKQKKQKETGNTQEEEPIAERWTSSTVLKYLKDKSSIGVLVICKTKNSLENGKLKRLPNPNIQEIPGGIPRIISQDIYERAQRKLATNREAKSHLPKDLENYLLHRGQIFCTTCGWKMHLWHAKDGYPIYRCNNPKCPDPLQISSTITDNYVWRDCCLLFEHLELLQKKLDEMIQREVGNLIEDTCGKKQIDETSAAIALAEQKRSLYTEGDYVYDLITQDIEAKKQLLKQYEETYVLSTPIAAMTDAFMQKVLEFRALLEELRGNYQIASFQEKRNALDVLGAKVYIKRLESIGHRSEKKIEVRYSPTFAGVQHATQS